MAFPCSILQILRITTLNQSKAPNGWVLPIVNEHEGIGPIEQAYLTYCEAGDIKGPHMHNGSKEDRFYCIRGSCVVVCRNEDTQEYSEFLLKELDDQVLIIPPYNSHAIVALNRQPAVVLSMPSEGYSKDKPYNQTETFYGDYDWSKWLLSY